MENTGEGKLSTEGSAEGILEGKKANEKGRTEDRSKIDGCEYVKEKKRERAREREVVRARRRQNEKNNYVE